MEMCLIRPTDGVFTRFVFQILVPVDPAPCTDIVQRAGIRSQNFQHRPRCQCAHRILGSNHRQRAQQAQGIEARCRLRAQMCHPERTWWGASGATVSTSPLPSGSSTLIWTCSASRPWV